MCLQKAIMYCYEYRDLSLQLSPLRSLVVFLPDPGDHVIHSIKLYYDLFIKTNTS